MRIIVGVGIVVIVLVWLLMRRDALDTPNNMVASAIPQKTPVIVDTNIFSTGLSGIIPQQAIVEDVLNQVHKKIIGLDGFIISLLISLLVPNGHVLVEGVPGLAKTKTIGTLADALDLQFKRIQFTPDMLPGDLTGVDVFNTEKKKFTFMEGPLFAQMILADEINRTTPKVQSALLEAMEEQQITIGHTSYPLPEPFFVLATQNPLEQEGTYPLPEAQVDRFFMKIHLAYPSVQEEEKILSLLESESKDIDPILHAQDIIGLQKEVQQVTLGDDVKSYIVRCIDATRKSPYFQRGASPRASISLMHGAKALAWLQGRNYVMHADIQALCLPILRHRVQARYEALAQHKDVDMLLMEVLSGVKLIDNV